MSAQVTMKLKMEYRRTESEPTNATVNDIRCKFESTSDGYTAPEVGLAFGAKRLTPSSTPTSESSSPVVPRKPSANPLLQLKSPTQHKKPVKQLSDSTLESLNSMTNKPVPIAGETAADKYKKAIVKPISLIIPNGNTTRSKQAIDKPSLIGLHNTGIVSTRKQQITSPIISPPAVAVKGLKSNKLEAEDRPSPDHKTSLKDKRATTLVTDNKVTTPVGDSNHKITAKDRRSVPEGLITRGAQQAKQPAKSFWKSISVNEATTPNSSAPSSNGRIDSVFEPGMDYAKLKKPNVSATGNVKDKPATNNAVEKSRFSPKITPKAVQLTAGNLKKVSESLTDIKTTQRLTTQSEDSKSTLNSLSKSPSVSSTCSSMDSLDIEYINGPFSHKVRRRDTKPPQNIVARRTQLFEKSMDDLNSVLEEAEAYNKVRDSGFGTVFTTASTKSTQSKPRASLTNSQLQLKSSTPGGKSADLINNNSRIADKNLLGLTSAQSKSDKHREIATSAKPLPALPSMTKEKLIENAKNSLKPPPTPASLKPKVNGPPPKPPRTFEHASLSPSSSNEIGFDPVVIPRQEGDGEENHDYEHHMTYQSPHVYTSVIPSSDSRSYATTTSADTRPYTSLTTTGGSGGDDSVAGSENAYDTLGRASVASSYEHYDTISQSELDSDVSRPPTLPRRPSNLRHRPLTTAFGNLDITKNATFHNQLNKALSSNAQTIKETSPTSPSPTKSKVPFKLKYLLPKARRKADEMRKASSMADLLDEKESLYDSVEVRPAPAEASWSMQGASAPDVPLDEAGYALPDIKVGLVCLFVCLSAVRLIL